MARLLPDLEPCRPPRWARSGHAQTLLGHLLPWRAPPVGGRRHEVRLEDGDRLVVRYVPGTRGVLVHLMHGLTGDAGSDYVRGCAAALVARGHGVLAMNHRGCGEGRGLCRGIYHSGRKEDVGAVFAFGRALEPDARQVAVGMSLSGNALLLALADPALPKPDAVLALNPPLDLAACADAIGRGWSRLYERRFVRRLRRLVDERWRDDLLDARPRLPRGLSLREFDQRFTAPHGGFADADDYYRRCSAGPHLKRVAVPTVIVTSADDPFVPVTDLRTAVLGTPLELHVEEHGGHLGYLSTSRGLRWLEYAVQRCVEALAAADYRAAPSSRMSR